MTQRLLVTALWLACAAHGAEKDYTRTGADIPPVKVDQFGYRSGAVKVAVIANPRRGFNAAQSFTPSATLTVVRASDGRVVHTG